MNKFFQIMFCTYTNTVKNIDSNNKNKVLCSRNLNLKIKNFIKLHIMYLEV